MTRETVAETLASVSSQGLSQSNRLSENTYPQKQPVKTPSTPSSQQVERSQLDRNSSRTHTKRTEQPTITVVIPALNEAENLRHVLPRIPSWVDEVVLVDGHSTDDTVSIASQLKPDIIIVTQEGRGKGAALRSGFAAASSDIIVMLDADGSTDPAEIPAFVGALLTGADFAKGSRFLQGGGTADMPLYRKLGNWGFVIAVRVLFGGQYTDLCYGYNAFWRRVLPQLALDCDGFEVETSMNIRALHAQLKIVEVPSFEAERIYGVGRLRTIPDGWRVLKTIVREWISGKGKQPMANRQQQRTFSRNQASHIQAMTRQPDESIAVRTKSIPS